MAAASNTAQSLAFPQLLRYSTPVRADTLGGNTDEAPSISSKEAALDVFRDLPQRIPASSLYKNLERKCHEQHI
jgi:hypothetical protein